MLSSFFMNNAGQKGFEVYSNTREGWAKGEKKVAVNWDSVKREAVDLLAGYVRINTTNPPGNETEAVRFVGRFLEREGLQVQYLGKEPTRMNLVCRISSGGDSKGLMLLHHCDVVEANAKEWSVPPFGGVVQDGYVWGRGAIDMKGMGVMEIMAFVLAHRERLPLGRDLLLVVASDEERGSRHGSAYLAEHHPKEVEAAWCINEGGSGSKIDGQPAILCCFGEKGPLRVGVSAKGRSGHGSRPHDDNPCDHLVKSLNKLLDKPRPLRIVPHMRRFLEGLGMGELSAGELESHALMQVPSIRARFQDTLSLTMLKAGTSPNVIPDRAEALLDIRVLPDRTTREVFEEVRQAISNGHVGVEFISSHEASSSSTDTELFQCMERTASRFFPDAVFLPAISPGYTDSRCFRELGTVCYGWIPSLFEPQDLDRVHGKDERIRTEDLVLGVRVIYAMIKEMCSKRVSL
jgi:acetylornithine deacetylase/succinyl-diaminopimelate desuccinylase-like protein